MRKYKKLILIPIVVIVVSLYVLGINIANRIDTFDETNIVQNPAAVKEIAEKTKVNINKAEKEELMTLEGIGSRRADFIIEKRKELGEFTSIEQIMEAEDIGEGIYEKIKDDITL